MFGVLRTLPLTFKKLETIQLSPLIKILEVNLVCKYRNTDIFFFWPFSGSFWILLASYGMFSNKYFSENFSAKLCPKMTKWDLLL